MATPFFWLPSASPHDLGNGGVPRYASGWTGYDHPGNDVKYPAGSGLGDWFKLINPYSGGGMPQYAVTQDPGRVSLTATGIQVSLSYSTPFPHFGPSTYLGSGCAYTVEGRASGYTDSLDPNYHFYTWRPFCNFVYQLRGTGNIAALDFYYRTSDTNPNTDPMTCNTVVRLDAWDTYYYIVNQHRVPSMFIGPAIVYTYRPGTGVIHNIMTVTGSTSGFHPGSGFGPDIERTTIDTAGATKRLYGQLGSTGRAYQTANITWQDGDLLVWEMWASSSGAPIHSYTSAYKTCSMMVGGGTSGQPLTVTGGVPNWAPAWVSKGTIAGYEPMTPRNPQVSVGF